VSFGYDVSDRVTTQTLPDTRTIGFGYDGNSNVTALTPPSRPAHTFTYTPVNLTSSYIPPTVTGAGATGCLFNVDRQPTEIQRPDGHTTTFTYSEPSGRLTSVGFSRNNAAATLQYGYDSAGRVSSLNDSGGVNLAFTYDGSLPLSETWSGALTGAVSRTFTNNFELNTESVNGAYTITFGYDDDRLLTSAGALTIARDATNGLVTDTTLGSTTETHQYNTFGEPTRQTSNYGTTQLFDVQTTRDNLGRITQRIETFPEITRTFHYSYDLAGRLQSVTRDGISGQVTVAAYTYDGNGNRLTAEGEAYGGVAPITATYDDQDRLLTYGNASYTYTANGELATKTVGGQTTSYVYDTLGNLVQVTLPTGDVISYTVDGRGRRVAKAINGTRVKAWLFADQLRPIAELDGSGNLVSRFVYGTKPNVPEYIIKNGTTYRVFSDYLGSPRVIVDTGTGAVVQRLDFQTFGEILQDSNPGWQPFGFAGGIYDPDTGLLRFGARDYTPTTGTWTSRDPILFDGQSTGLFTYVDGDPVNHFDPDGLILMRIPQYSQPGWMPDWLWTFVKPDPSDLMLAPAPLATISALEGPGLKACKLALKKVHDIVGKIKKVGNPQARLGSAMRGNPKFGYRGPEPPHPRALPGSPEEGWHFNWWDFTEGKWNRGAGPGAKGAIKIE
jgi:RHS repeat-associated protein